MVLQSATPASWDMTFNVSVLSTMGKPSFLTPSTLEVVLPSSLVEPQAASNVANKVRQSVMDEALRSFFITTTPLV
ncbi:hypothetical protein D3C76_1559770 [compost metagenome]